MLHVNVKIIMMCHGCDTCIDILFAFESISLFKYKLLVFQVVISVLTSLCRTSLSTLIDELNCDLINCLIVYM